MDWTDDRISELTKLWNEGLSTAEIGKLLGISKNAVVGKAHRLRLASRPSPIRRMAIRPATPRVPRATRNLAMSAVPGAAMPRVFHNRARLDGNSGLPPTAGIWH